MTVVQPSRHNSQFSQSGRPTSPRHRRWWRPRLKVRLHGGDGEIGGNCVELRSGKDIVILDIGRPLTAPRNAVVPLPPIRGLETGRNPHLHGVVISHGHQDHWGLIPQVHRNVPSFIGKPTAQILRVAEFWGTGIDLHETGHLEHLVPLSLGPFTVTPYLIDHSAFDAYALLVECRGERVFYTGDFRAHGRKSRLVERLISDPPADIDYLICEGTHVSASVDTGAADEDDARSANEIVSCASEDEVEDQLTELLTDADGLVVVLCSPQNIDRIVSVYRACLRSDRDMAVDLYGSQVLAAAGQETIPIPSAQWPRVLTYVTGVQRRRVRRASAFDMTRTARAHRIFPEQLMTRERPLVLAGSFSSEISALLAMPEVKISAVVWSMWEGYLSEPSGQRLASLLESHGVPLVHAHTSGHAGLADLSRLITAMQPTRLIPIHTEHPDLLHQLGTS